MLTEKDISKKEAAAKIGLGLETRPHPEQASGGNIASADKPREAILPRHTRLGRQYCLGTHASGGNIASAGGSIASQAGNIASANMPPKYILFVIKYA